MQITITIDYDEEYNEASVNMTIGMYNDIDYGTCETTKEVKDAVVYATREIQERLAKAGMKD